MTEVVVTRGGQITLTKDVRDKLGIREGDVVHINIEGDMARVSKRDPSVFEHHNFLPENFDKVLKAMRTSASLPKRLKRLGIIP